MRLRPEQLETLRQNPPRNSNASDGSPPGCSPEIQANRLLRFAQRRQECVLYDFLGRTYDGEAARRGER